MEASFSLCGTFKTLTKAHEEYRGGEMGALKAATEKLKVASAANSRRVSNEKGELPGPLEAAELYTGSMKRKPYRRLANEGVQRSDPPYSEQRVAAPSKPGAGKARQGGQKIEVVHRWEGGQGQEGSFVTLFLPRDIHSLTPPRVPVNQTFVERNSETAERWAEWKPQQKNPIDVIKMWPEFACLVEEGNSDAGAEVSSNSVEGKALLSGLLKSWYYSGYYAGKMASQK